MTADACCGDAQHWAPEVVTLGARKLILVVVLTWLLAGSCPVAAQAALPASRAASLGFALSPSSAQGTLTVTAVVMSSVGLVVGADGQQRLVIANAPDPADNVSSLRMVPLKPISASRERRAKYQSRKLR